MFAAPVSGARWFQVHLSRSRAWPNMNWTMMDTLTRGHQDRRDGIQPVDADVTGDNGAAPSWTGASGISQLFSILAAGIICGLLAVMFSISAAALLFSGDLSEHVTVAIAVCLFGTIVLSCVIAVFSSCPGMVSVSQEVTVVALSVIAMSIHAAMAGVRSEADIVSTIVVMIGLATSVTGLCLLAMGIFRLGRLIRFIPYPVIGGFLAGMGWLIVVGALSVILGDTLTLQNADVLFEAPNVAKWLPAMLFACAVGASARWTGSSFILPVAVVVALILFHASAWLLEVPVAQLQAEGWLFQPLAQAGIWPPLSGNPFAGVDWSVIWAETPKVIALVAITATSVLFASSGIELSVRHEVDLDRELRAAGIANLLAGSGGGAAGFQGLGLTILGHQLGAPYRLVGIIVAIVCASMLFFGGSLLA
ncbi:MAG: SulP family inorganic anion transporter, partial [Pseudomonadota bacterium]